MLDFSKILFLKHGNGFMTCTIIEDWKGMMNKIWIISDTHFGHDMEWADRKSGFEEKILESLRCVNINDMIIHLGDVSFYDDKKWHLEFFRKVLTNKKILIRGNHDKRSMSWYLDIGWNCVCDSIVINAFGFKILFSHIPLALNGNDINVHGHFHNKQIEEVRKIEPEYVSLHEDGKHILISLENSKYQILSLESIIKNYRKGKP